MEHRRKKYEKPGIVFQDFATGQITGTPEMVGRLIRECEDLSENPTENVCWLENDIPCLLRQTL